MEAHRRPKLAVWKFTSCDGCQLSLLDCEDELLELAEEAVEIAFFAEATSAVIKGPYDISLVEGSITIPYEAKYIKKVRKASKFIIAMGACATAGGIQALRNFNDIDEFKSIVYANPQYLSTLEKSTPISDHIPIDFELQGCPINKQQLIEALTAFLHGGRPNIRSYSVCIECKIRGTVCLMVARGKPCLGPITHAGCNAICPTYNRGCYGCYGLKETPNIESLIHCWRQLGVSEDDIQRSLRTFNAEAVHRVREFHEEK